MFVHFGIKTGVLEIVLKYNYSYDDPDYLLDFYYCVCHYGITSTNGLIEFV